MQPADGQPAAPAPAATPDRASAARYDAAFSALHALRAAAACDREIASIDRALFFVGWANAQRAMAATPHGQTQYPA